MSLLIAAPKDRDAIMELINDCVTDMQNKGIDQWGDFYPTQDIVERDIRQECLYFLEIQNEIAGVVTLNEDADPLYSQIQWSTDDKKPLIVHRLAVAPAFQNQGYAHTIMQWVEGYAKSHDYTSIRLDAYQGNPAAMKLYENNEYTKTGEVTFPHRSQPFNCYEKVLDLRLLNTNNHWTVIYQTISYYQGLVETLKEKGFTVEVFCDPQCEEVYTPGLQYGDCYVAFNCFVAVHKDQRLDALRILKQWQQQEKQEYSQLRISTFRKALISTFWSLLMLILVWVTHHCLTLELRPYEGITTLVILAAIVWIGVFWFQVRREQSTD